MNGATGIRKSHKVWTAFKVQAPDAEDVVLVGSLAEGHWSQMAMREENDGEWTVTLRLTPGWYCYFFMIDGIRVLDPQSNLTAPDPVWGEVSLLQLK